MNPSDSARADLGPAGPGWRERWWRIIFLSDTPAGKAFDLALMALVLLSVLAVMLETVEGIREGHGAWLSAFEWVVTGLFTLEYVTRLVVVRKPWRYVFSFYGVVDILALLPSLLELVFAGTHYLMTIRALRLLRMFRVLKMARYLGEANLLLGALRASRVKILVFLFSVMALVCIQGSLMYVLEHDVNKGFRNIPQAVYWAIVTITTVGYGDVTPVTVLGKVLASLIMMTGFAILAVPTGIVTAELGREMALHSDRRRCPACGWAGHEARARFCHQCGGALPAEADR